MKTTTSSYQAFVKGYLYSIYRDGSKHPSFRNVKLRESFERGMCTGNKVVTAFTKDLHKFGRPSNNRTDEM